MRQTVLGGAALSGVIGLAIGLISTALVNVVVPTTNLRWSLIAVAIASFFAAFAGYIVGMRQESQ